MEKLAQELKKRLSNLIEFIKGCKNHDSQNKGYEEGEEPELKSAQGEQDREIRVAALNAPKRPGVSKGPPPQIN